MIWPGNKTLVISRYSFVKGVTQEFQDVWDVLRVVHLSDLQGACFGNDNMELLGRVSDTKPHLIVFTGDLVDRRMQVNKDFEAAIDFMKNLRMIAPTFFSYGNHELAFSQDIVRALREKLENTGVVVLDGTSHIENVKIRKLPDDKLRDESRRNDDTASRNVEVLLTGFPERLLMVEGRNRTKKNSDVDQDVLKSAVEEIKQKRSESQCDISILLAHEPQFIEEYSSASYDYIFSGHAHGGQIRLPILGGLFSPGQGILPKYTSGVHNAGNGKMIISRGLGNSSFPIRVFNRPEIIIAEIHI